MPAISVEEAKQSLQAILEKVAKGEEVTIDRTIRQSSSSRSPAAIQGAAFS